jgi:pyrroloquinoline quinone biosynthesis protein E
MTGIAPPYGLLAEITHRCPLHCVYCSNPLELRQRHEELDTGQWLRVIDEAADLGVVQMHLSGGEPLARPDLETLVTRASDRAVYSNLITSGLGLTPARAEALASAGLNSVQLSVQGHDAESANLIAATRRFDKKRQAAGVIREVGLPLNMNVVLHRLNLDHLDAIIDLCVEWGAERLELANTQYYGWALRNQKALLPGREQLARAEAVYERRKAELADRVELIWIVPDYHERFPKPCMGGWAQTSVTVAPDGLAYPCSVAAEITTIEFPSVREHDLAWVWWDSEAFNAFRGTEWMPGPCRECSRRDMDFGGCRCQAFALTGDPARTDPVCVYSPDHQLVRNAVDWANRPYAGSAPSAGEQLEYRRVPVHARSR